MDKNDNIPVKEISLSFIEESLMNIENSENNSEVENEDIDLNSPYLEAAAVMIFYKPKTINPLSTTSDFIEEERDNAIKELIGCSEVVLDTNHNNNFTDLNIDSLQSSQSLKNIRNISLENETVANPKIDNKVSFILKDEVRRKVLIKLIKQDKIKQAIKANVSPESSSNNVLQSMFQRCLLQDAPPLKSLNLEQLNAMCHIADWLGETNGIIEFPPKKEIKRRIEMVEMLMPFKHLTGQYFEGEFIEQFRGRREELATLRKYVGVATPQSALETVQRYVQHYIEPVFNLEKKPPLLVFGLGGIGKSTLLAKFILEHAEAHQTDRFPFVYLDFDRPNLSALEPETLLKEAARQLSVQYSDIEELVFLFTNFLNRWNSVSSLLMDSKNTESVSIKSNKASRQTRTNRDAMLYEFVQIVEVLSKKESKPFLIILDTFEEVQYKGKGFIEVLYHFMKELQSKYPFLRTVIAGRAPIYEFPTQVLELKSLDSEAANGFLLKMGVKDPKVIKTIISKVGGNPLSLRLAYELIKNSDSQELQKTNLSKQRFLFLEERLSEVEIQGILYRRILAHIHNPKVRELAHPGLVLRRITPKIILKVLADPCQLKISTNEEAEELFKEISREVSLVRQEGPFALRHRADVRKVMLKLIKESKPEIVKDIHQRAAEFYAAEEGISNRAEEFYHRLSLNQSRRSLDSRWLDGIQNYLMGSFDEFSPKAQAYLSARTGMESSDLSIWDEADVEDLERRTVWRVSELLNSGLPEKALKVINENIQFSNNSNLSFLKEKAFSQLKRYNEAQETSHNAINMNSDLDNSQITSGLNLHTEENNKNDSSEDEEDNETRLFF